MKTLAAGPLQILLTVLLASLALAISPIGTTDDAAEFVHIPGGSWFNSPKFVRSSERYPNVVNEAAFSVGFRLAEDAR